MPTPKSHLPICSVRNKPVKLETSKIDELGKAIHEGCYLLKVGLRRATPLRPRQSIRVHSSFAILLLGFVFADLSLRPDA